MSNEQQTVSKRSTRLFTIYLVIMFGGMLVIAAFSSAKAAERNAEQQKFLHNPEPGAIFITDAGTRLWYQGSSDFYDSSRVRVKMGPTDNFPAVMLPNEFFANNGIKTVNPKDPGYEAEMNLFINSQKESQPIK